MSGVATGAGVDTGATGAGVDTGVGVDTGAGVDGFTTGVGVTPPPPPPQPDSATAIADMIKVFLNFIFFPFRSFSPICC